MTRSAPAAPRSATASICRRCSRRERPARDRACAIPRGPSWRRSRRSSAAWCSSIFACSMRRSNRVGSAAVLALVLVAPAARGQAIGQGFDLERQGRLEQAAAVYTGVLRGEPVNLPALLGLERVLSSLGRLPALLPLGIGRASGRG